MYFGVEMKNKIIYISNYIDNVKKTAYLKVENIENLILSKDINSNFIKNFLFQIETKKITKIFIFKCIFLFYFKNFLKLFLFLIELIIFKVFGKKSKLNWNQNIFIIDIYFIVNNIVQKNEFKDNYFGSLYRIFKKYNKNYIFLPRLYKDSKNPFSLIKLLKITNKNSVNRFLYEYELLSAKDVFKTFVYVLKYPFMQFELLQNNGHDLDKSFNYELFNVLPLTSFSVFIRYLIGKKIAEKASENTKVISWQEFQSIEKSFNRAIKESGKDIKIYGCEFLVGYESYISMQIEDLDVDLNITPHQTLLNGKSNYSKSKKQIFRQGVSLRYEGLFKFKNKIKKSVKPLVLLGYDINESLNILKRVGFLDDLYIKMHPTLNKEQFDNYRKTNWNYVYGDLYQVMEDVDIVFTSPFSGTSLEAVAAGVSTVIIASERSLTCPLTKYGKGEIWDVAFNMNDVQKRYNDLLEFKKHNPKKIRELAFWYKENFFIEPTEDNIIKAFELNI
jgi:hypothetical protein